jgi:hypothetical protein
MIDESTAFSVKNNIQPYVEGPNGNAAATSVRSLVLLETRRAPITWDR